MKTNIHTNSNFRDTWKQFKKCTFSIIKESKIHTFFKIMIKYESISLVRESRRGEKIIFLKFDYIYFLFIPLEIDQSTKLQFLLQEGVALVVFTPEVCGIVSRRPASVHDIPILRTSEVVKTLRKTRSQLQFSDIFYQQMGRKMDRQCMVQIFKRPFHLVCFLECQIWIHILL